MTAPAIRIDHTAAGDRVSFSGPDGGAGSIYYNRETGEWVVAGMLAHETRFAPGESLGSNRGGAVRRVKRELRDLHSIWCASAA